MAVKPSKSKVEKSLNEYVKLAGKIAAAEAKYQKAVAPAKARFDKATAKHLGALEKVRGRFQPELEKLKAAVESEMLLGVDANGAASLPQVLVPGAVAKVAHSTTRTIDSKQWIEATPPEARDARWFKCVSILITQVDKQFGTDFAHLIQTVRKSRVTVDLVATAPPETAAEEA